MQQLSQEFQSGEARLRVDVQGRDVPEQILDEMNYLNYRLASVQILPEAGLSEPDIVWFPDRPEKDILCKDEKLVLEGEWYQGEIQKIIVAALALKMEMVGLHPFHSSAVRYREHTILFLGGEDNHGKTMCQIEGSRRGGQIVSTETTVTDERGWAVMGSKNVFLRHRSKGTERADKPNQDEGVAKLFEKTPEFVTYDEPTDIDLVIVPDIDGHYSTQVAELARFEREYQTFHSLINYIGLHLMLAPGLAMPIIDTPELRVKRADFCHRFSERLYYFIRAKTPQLLFDEVERFL